MDSNSKIVYGCLVVAVLGTVWYLSQEPDKTKDKIAVKHVATGSSKESEYNADDYTARFDRPAGPVRNLFIPAVKGGIVQDLGPNGRDPFHVPASCAGGDGNWIFTGIAIVSGEKTALLENTTMHQAGYVKEGQPWKTSRVLRITSDGVAFTDGGGSEQTVLRYNPDAGKKSSNAPGLPGPLPGIAPVNPQPAMSGPIGPENMQIRPMPNRGVRFINGSVMIEQ